jgi:SAM-dependent methyltransferase
MSSPISDETLERLKREREEADVLYNAALTALDRALPALALPDQGEDDGGLARLSTIVTSDPLASLAGWRRRLAGFVWRLVGPMLRQQQEFNAAVAERLAVERERHLAPARAFAALSAFHQHLILYLQQITLFVESKDREAVATVHRYLSDGLSGLADAIAKRWESMLARDQRYEARLSETASELADIRASIGTWQQASHMLKRELERLRAGASVQHPAPGAGHAAPGSGTQHSAPSTQHSLDAYKYVGFEDQFRGSPEEIRTRLADYLPCFDGASEVLDIGCGRGEFLQLLGERGVKARGIDINHEMVEACRDKGLNVVEGDALEYLESLPEASLGGLFAAQVVEHLEPDRLIALLGVAFGTLRPGSRIVLETINPACWAAFFDSYIRDLTHVRPIHPETLKYLLQASGFQAPEIRYRSPYPEFARLQPVAIPEAARQPSGDWSLLDVAETFNENVEKLNAKLFTHRDYAVVATRG